MKILILSKRQYTHKDLLDDRYGRVYEMSRDLAERGHHVLGVTLSYRLRHQGQYTWDECPGLEWRSWNLLSSGLLGYIDCLKKAAAAFSPDVIWATSDAIHAIIGGFFSRVSGVPLVVDLYDNYESFSLTKLPFLKSLLRKVCREADGVTVVSKSLMKFIISEYKIKSPAKVLINGVREEVFYPRGKCEARELLNLPASGFLVGTAGALVKSRGISVLYEAFLRLAEEFDNLYLVVAGPRDDTPEKFKHSRIIDLGELPLETVPYLYSSLDIGVVCNQDTSFGRYCFPLKLSEMIACGIPVISAALGDFVDAYVGGSGFLYRPGEADDLASKIKNLISGDLDNRSIKVFSWSEVGAELESFLRQVAET